MVVTNGRAVARGCGGADNRAEIWLGRGIGVWREWGYKGRKNVG
jgi:hypothetical protein